MAEDISELVVKMRPEGTEATRQGLQSVEEGTQQTTEAMQEQSDAAEGFLQEFEGAMGAAVAALTVASAGLLSQVPVIGQAMEGLFSIVEAVAFQMDQRLRPVLGPISSFFFDLSSAIFEAEGFLGNFAGALGNVIVGITAAIGVLTPFLGLSGSLSTVFGTLVSIGGAVVGAFASLAGILGVSATGLGAVVLAVGALVAAWKTDFLGIRTRVINALQTIGNFVLGLGDKLGDIKDAVINGLAGAMVWLVNTGKTIVEGSIDSVIEAAGDVWGWFTDGLPDLIKAGIDLLVEGIKNKVEDVKEAAIDIKDAIIDNIPTFSDMLDIGKDLITGLIEGIKNKAGDLADAVKNLGGGGNGGTQTNLGTTTASSVSMRTAEPVFFTALRQSDNNGQTANITNGDRTQIIEVDGRTFGELSSRKQRSITASRNIDG
jgi:hypothetical protein